MGERLGGGLLHRQRVRRRGLAGRGLSPPLPRAAFPVVDRWAFLNHAGVNPLPAPAVAAMAAWAADAAADGSLAWDPHLARAEQVRALAARLMGVAADEVAFVKNTTEGIGFVANGLTWRPGDRVVVPAREFPSNFYPWRCLRDLGVTVDVVEPVGPGRCLPVERLARAVTDGRPPKVVAVSWVQFGRGWRTDLAALATACHHAGALLCVDAIQGLGVVPARLHDWGVDFATADAHKWLLGPPGIGVLYVRRTCLHLLRPLEPGWASVAHREDYDDPEVVWDAGARRLEGGTVNMPGVFGLGAALELLLDAGVDRVWAHVSGLCERACQGLADAGATVLSDRSPGGRSAIVTFALDGHDPAELSEVLRRQGVVCSPRGGGVRVSPHGYNTAEEVDRLLAVVAGLERPRP